jgi:hypothetical protein
MVHVAETSRPVSGARQVIAPGDFSVEMTCAGKSRIARQLFGQFHSAHDPLRAKTRFRVPLTLIGGRKMKKAKERSRKITESLVLLAAFTAFLAWAAYSTWSGRELKIGTILLGALLSAGALWCGSLFGIALGSFLKMKSRSRPPENNARDVT